MKISRDPDTNFPGNGKSQNPEFPGKFPVPPSREETLIDSNKSRLRGQWIYVLIHVTSVRKSVKLLITREQL